MKFIDVYGYARKSPDDKLSTDSSIDNQVKLFGTTCSEKSNDEVTWRLVKVFIDRNISGGDRFRKGFTDMCQSAIKNDVRMLMCKNQERFARDSSFFLDTLKDLEVRNIRVYSIMKGQCLSSEDIGDAIMSVVSGQYIVDQKKKAILLQQQKIEEGLPCIPPPFGYKYNKKKSWIIEKKKAGKVLAVYSDLKNHVHYKTTIAENRINKSLYYRILKNIEKGLYSGWIIYNKKYKDSNKMVVRTEEIKYKGNHEPIIKEDEVVDLNGARG